MGLFHQDKADTPAVDGAVLQGNRADNDGADTSDLDSNQAAGPGGSPFPFDSPLASSISSLMSGFSDTTDALMSFWTTECAPEVHFSDLNYSFPCPLQIGSSLALDLLLPFGGELATNPGQAETLFQAPYSPPEIPLTLSPSQPSTLCPPVSRDQDGDRPPMAGSAIPDPPPTPSSSASPPPPLGDIQDGSSPTSLHILRHILCQHYANRKPPGRMFANFISLRDNMKQCTLCPYKIRNREQLNQHIMKVHCNHFPFACLVPGCGHRDVRPADLKKHLAKHEVARWRCEHCGQQVQHERNLYRHIENKHPEVRQAPRSRRKPFKKTNKY